MHERWLLCRCGGNRIGNRRHVYLDIDGCTGIAGRKREYLERVERQPADEHDREDRNDEGDCGRIRSGICMMHISFNYGCHKEKWEEK